MTGVYTHRFGPKGAAAQLGEEDGRRERERKKQTNKPKNPAQMRVKQPQ